MFTQDNPQAVLARLASLIHDFDRSRISPECVRVARAAIRDTVGVTLAGVHQPCVTHLMQVPGVATAQGRSSIFGSALRTSALDAALINGTASHAVDFDDFSQPMGGHQSVPLTCTLIAIAEERRLSGLQLIQSYVVGIETEIRLARSVNFHHYDKGWHPTATLGIFGAAAAAGHMMDLSTTQLTVALSIAASLSCGIKANFGTMVKPLHVGQCGRNGLFAALLAEAGYDANPFAMEHKQGFLNVYNGPDTYSTDMIFEKWADPLEVLDSTMGLKQFPCCGSTHPAISMMLKLRQEHSLQPNDVRRIEILVHRRRLAHTDNPDPQSDLAAKFSIQYVVCRALLSGAVRLSHFEKGAHRDAEVRALMARTSVGPHPEMADDSPTQFGAEVRVMLHTGHTVLSRIDNVVGRGSLNPLSREEQWIKFEDCASQALPAEQIAPLFDQLGKLEQVSDVNAITTLLARRAS